MHFQIFDEKRLLRRAPVALLCALDFVFFRLQPVIFSWFFLDRLQRLSSSFSIVCRMTTLFLSPKTPLHRPQHGLNGHLKLG